MVAAADHHHRAGEARAPAARHRRPHGPHQKAPTASQPPDAPAASWNGRLEGFCCRAKIRPPMDGRIVVGGDLGRAGPAGRRLAVRRRPAALGRRCCRSMALPRLAAGPQRAEGGRGEPEGPRRGGRAPPAAAWQLGPLFDRARRPAARSVASRCVLSVLSHSPFQFRRAPAPNPLAPTHIPISPSGHRRPTRKTGDQATCKWLAHIAVPRAPSRRGLAKQAMGQNQDFCRHQGHARQRTKIYHHDWMARRINTRLCTRKHDQYCTAAVRLCVATPAGGSREWRCWGETRLARKSAL